MPAHLRKDRKGNIWIGTFGGFMNVFDRSSGKIKRIEPAILNDERKVVRKTKAASDGNIIAATANGFFKVDPRGTVIDSVMMSSSIHLANVSITDFLEYENDKLVITSTTGLFLLDWKNRSIVPVPFLPAQKIVRCIEEDKEETFG
jgi:ligand-binding sensor domain-containing protein